MLHPSFSETYMTSATRNDWAVKFLDTFADYTYKALDDDQFKGALERLSFPQGYIDWLIFMCTREQTTP